MLQALFRTMLAPNSLGQHCKRPCSRLRIYSSPLASDFSWREYLLAQGETEVNTDDPIGEARAPRRSQPNMALTIGLVHLRAGEHFKDLMLHLRASVRAKQPCLTRESLEATWSCLQIRCHS